ncbi:hypothetical protein [Burkholderia glumae]|nr:hypothetical protein [Burkholderia glumae]MCQ0034007.1 hypothetical protein [Burkholderia glumae]MCQ0040230.1 hypothetical protein [Burkholderia glumae]QHE12698.1 hypothetical protein GQR88_20365 [Burkholderia glumae AU6208]QJW80707.1 hypothetical protein GAS18_18330 [Burkholderia glumae]
MKAALAAAGLSAPGMNAEPAPTHGQPAADRAAACRINAMPAAMAGTG